MNRREGTITPRGKTSWQLKFDVPSEDGKRKTIRETVTARNRSEARKLLTARLNERDTGILVEPNRISLVEAVLDAVSAARYVAKFDLRCREIVRLHIEPFFGNRRLQDIRPVDLDKFQTALRHKTHRNRPLADATVIQIVKLVRRALKRATALQLIGRNPALGVALPKRQRHEITILAVADLQRLVEGLGAHPWPSLSRLGTADLLCRAYRRPARRALCNALVRSRSRRRYVEDPPQL